MQPSPTKYWRFSLRFTVLFVLFLILVGQAAHYRYGDDIYSALAHPSPKSSIQDLSILPTTPLHHRHVAITTTFRGHSEVWSAVAWALGRVFDREANRDSTLRTSVGLYTESPGFVELMQTLDNLPFPILPKERFVEDLLSTTLFEDDPGAQIDMVILGTCELDLGRLSDVMLAAWDARPADHKFTVVCIVHNAGSNNWFPIIREWSRRGAIRIMPISDHVAKRFKDVFADLSGSPDPKFNTGFYDFVKIAPFYPVSNLTVLISPPAAAFTRVLSHAAVQGYYQQGRRDYSRILADLKAHLEADASVWGYLPLGSTGVYEVDPAGKASPFQLHLVGGGEISIAKELANVIVLDKNLNAVDFYEKIQSMDIMVPAFSKGGGYLFSQASSTIHTSVECNVPILATISLRESYPYLDDTATVIRPHGLSEIEAIRLLRSGLLQGSETVLSQGPIEFRQAVDRMMESGWLRSPDRWMELKENIWAKNEAMLARLLRDM